MDKEGGALEDVDQKIGKKKKMKSKKDGLQESHNIDATKANESTGIYEKENTGIYDKENIAGTKSNDKRGGDKRGREKKNMDNNKNGKLETGNAEEVKVEVSEQLPEGRSVSGRKSRKEAKNEQKKEKMKRDHGNGNGQNDEGEEEGGGVGTHCENCKVDAIEMVERKKKTKDRKKSFGNDLVGPQDMYSDVKHDESDFSSLQQDNMPVGGDVQSTKYDGNAMREPERKKKKKHKKRDDSSAVQQDSVDNGSNGLVEMQINEAEYANKRKKKKKTKFVENNSDDGQDNEVECAGKGKKRESKLAESGSSDATPNKSNKKVRFSGEVEVFPLPGDSNPEKGNDKEDNLVRGKRFTREEDQIVKDAVLKYIDEHDLGDEGLDMVLYSSKHPELKGCWKQIGTCIPYRPYVAIYCRARVLFMRSATRKWTQEEKDLILKHAEEHGNDWKTVAVELGKHPWHVKDTYRRIKLTNLQKGHWSQEEYQRLFDLVNTDLQLKVTEEKKSKHGMLRDNICWSAISDELSTRTQADCCVKWYKKLTSPMVAEGAWVDSDDYRLLSALYSLDAACTEDVDWDDLIENRSGDICRKRWNQMVFHIGHHKEKSFAEQVEVLAQRYCPNLLEAREIWDSKPRVP